MNKLQKALYEDTLGLAGRSHALKKGKLTYIGTQCKRGHGGMKYVSNNQCVECRNEHSKMIAIDHLLEKRAENKFFDEYYSEDFV